MGFNTASGKYYCNNKIDAGNLRPGVSIPQAVSTIAMLLKKNAEAEARAEFQYRKR